MAKSRVSCKMVPEVPGTNEDSKMYIELSKLVKNRPLTNLIYASYLQDGVADQMDALGYSRNPQGQHRAREVYKFFDVGDMKNNTLGISAQSKALGFTDNNGVLIDFDAVDAYTKAQEFNNNNKGRVSSVVQHGDKFNILIEEKDSTTQNREVEVNRSLMQWNKLAAELQSTAIDINELNQINPALVNPGSIPDFLRNLSVYKLTPNDGLSVKDIEMILALNPFTPIVNNILSRGWGSTRAEVAQRMYDIIHNGTATQSNVDLVNNVLNEAKKLTRLDVGHLRTEVREATKEFEDLDTSTNIQKTLDDLDKKYHLENESFVRESTKIEKFSDATADAIMSLERQIRVMENKSGKTAQSEALRATKDKLFDELKHKRYASGLLEFMTTAVNYIRQINNNLNSVSATGTNLEVAHKIAEVTTQATNLKNAYYDVIKAISDSDLVNDFAINTTDKEALQSLARDLKQLFDSQNAKVKDMQKDAMMAIGEEFIGKHNSLYGKDLADIINMSEADATMRDYLYGIGRSSNTVISMLGAIIRDAQSERDFKLNNIALQIRRINNILMKDGKDSSFMYDDKGRIVSEYDWDSYNKAKRKYAGRLVKAGFDYKSADFEVEMEKWEEQNTVEVVVDKTNGRTERMPAFYLNNFREGWSRAQNEYYDRMMELKGQIGSLLPAYAQHQYIAPQKRTSWDQVLKEGIKGERSFGNVARWFLENSKIWKMKEADTRFRKSGILINGDESLASLSGYDNTILRQIPLFYVKKIDVGNLSHDFSSAIQSLASTALNYQAMDSIRDVAEMMTDYAAGTAPVEQDGAGRPKVDTSFSKGLNIITNLRKSAKDNRVSNMLDSFVLKHIYGVENKSEGLGAVICANLIGYTSLKGLAVNVKGALTNKYVGIIQTMIKACGGQYYNFKELAGAEAILLGTQGGSTTGALLGGTIGGAAGAAIGFGVGTAVGAAGMAGKFMDIITDNRNSKDTLIADFFDQAQESYSSLSDQRYHSTMFGRLFGHFNPMAMYQRGEYWIHMLNVYATLLHEKVIAYDPDTGTRKTISLYEALEKGEKIDGNSELKVKDNIYKLDGTKLEDMSDNYFTAMKRRIRYINQQCHGSMNKEDKGLLHQWMIGKMTMNFRQWMVEHYSRRFRRLHWDESIRDTDLSNFYTKTKVLLDNKKVKLIDALEMVDNGTGDGTFHYEIKANARNLEGKHLTDEMLNQMLNDYAEDAGWRRGFKTDTFKVIGGFFKEYKDYRTSANAYWNSLSETQKADVKQVLGEVVMLMALTGLSACMGDPDDHEGEFFYRLWMYVVKRCLFDEWAATIPGAVVEAKTIVNNPIASVQTVAGLLYPVFGIGDINKTIQSGRYAGWNKYERNILKYTIPFYSQIDQLLHIDTEDNVFGVFSNQLTR